MEPTSTEDIQNDPYLEAMESDDIEMHARQEQNDNSSPMGRANTRMNTSTNDRSDNSKGIYLTFYPNVHFAFKNNYLVTVDILSNAHCVIVINL